MLRVDRIVAAEALPETFTPPPGLDALRTLEERLSQGWTYPVDVLVDAPADETSRWLPGNLGLLEPDGEGRTRLRATTDNPGRYGGHLAALAGLRRRDVRPRDCYLNWSRVLAAQAVGMRQAPIRYQ